MVPEEQLDQESVGVHQGRLLLQYQRWILMWHNMYRPLIIASGVMLYPACIKSRQRGLAVQHAVHPTSVPVHEPVTHTHAHNGSLLLQSNQNPKKLKVYPAQVDGDGNISVKFFSPGADT